jgi:hypothetical protein
LGQERPEAVIPQFVPLVDRRTKGYNVSFEDPALDVFGVGVYVLHMRSADDAGALAALLRRA